MPRILIADDEVIARILMQETLAIDSSWSFIEAEDGAQAVELALHEEPDLIILDVMMPKMDGIQACRIIKADPSFIHTPILIISAKDGDEARIAGLDAGAVDYIRKPYEATDLEARVRQALIHEKSA